jgi:hypothetical protein
MRNNLRRPCEGISCHFADFNEKVIGLLMRVSTMSIEIFGKCRSRINLGV